MISLRSKLFLVPACLTALAGSARAEASPPTLSQNVSPHERIEVRGRRPATAQHLDAPIGGGALGTMSQMDTPFSTSIVTHEQMQNRQVHKLGDVFANDASVGDNSDSNSSWSTYVTVRGLPLDYSNGYKIDGRPFIGYGITLPYEQLEQVELLKGLSGFMYGFGAPGGIINYETRKAPDSPVRSLDAGIWSDSVWRVHTDIGNRFGRHGMFGYRVDYTHEEGRTYNDGTLDRDSLSTAFDARLTSELTWDFASIDQNRRASGQTPSIYTGLLSGSLPRTIENDSNRLSSRDQHLNTMLHLYTTGFAYRLGPDWNLGTNYSFSRGARSRNESTLTLQDAAGNYTDARYDGHENDQFNQWQALLQGNPRTGPVTHRLVLGAAWQQQVDAYSRNSIYTPLGAGNLVDRYANHYQSVTEFDVYHAATITQKAVFGSDTLTLGRWSLLAALRATDYSQHGYALTGGTASRYIEDAVLTPSFALMFKPSTALTAYVSFVESLEQGSIAGSTYANYGELLKPLRSRQYELGLKTDHTGWSGTAALFRIERGAEYGNAANRLVQNGTTIFQGGELAGAARISRQLQAQASALWLDSHYTGGSGFDGNRVAGAPKLIATAQLTYQPTFVPALDLVAGMKHTGRTSVHPAADLFTDDYTLFHLAGIYRTHIARHDVTVRGAIDNLFDHRYWEFQYSDYIKPGDPRTYSLNVKVNF